MPINFLRVTGQELPYKQTVFICVAALYLFIGGRRSLQRWMGISLVRNVKKYQWNIPIGNERKSRVLFYLYLECFVHVAMGIVFYSLATDALPVVIALFALGIDHLLYALAGKVFNLFRIGITKSALVIVDRDIRVIYFSGLRKISTQQHLLFFHYLNDMEMNVSYDAIPKEEMNKFKEVLVDQINEERVYLDATFKQLN